MDRVNNSKAKHLYWYLRRICKKYFTLSMTDLDHKKSCYLSFCTHRISTWKNPQWFSDLFFSGKMSHWICSFIPTFFCFLWKWLTKYITHIEEVWWRMSTERTGKSKDSYVKTLMRGFSLHIYTNTHSGSDEWSHSLRQFNFMS